MEDPPCNVLPQARRVDYTPEGCECALCCFRDVIDPAVLAQSAYVAVAVQHGYARVNATRTSLTLQVKFSNLSLSRFGSELGELM